MNRANIACVSLLLVASMASADPPPPNAPAGGETLRVPAYPSATPWKAITNKKNDRMEMVEWIPADQSEDTISDILTKQVFYTMKGKSPKDFIGVILKGVAQACTGVRMNGPTQQTENGYPVSYAQAYCINQKGASKDVDIFIKAMGGTEALYVVQREFRRPAQPGATPGLAVFSKDQVDEVKARLSAQTTANRFLVDQVQLCPPMGGTGACQSGP